MAEEMNNNKYENIQAAIRQLTRKAECSDKYLSMIKSDMEFGLEPEDIEIYLNIEAPEEKKSMISKALREYDRDIAMVLAESSLTMYQMQMVLSYYGRGVSIDSLRSGILNSQNGQAMKAFYEDALKAMEQATAAKDFEEQANEMMQTVLSEVRAGLEGFKKNESELSQLKSLISELSKIKGTSEDMEKLYQDFAEKDQIIENQQNHLNELNGVCAKQRKQIVEQEEIITSLKEQLKEKAETVKAESAPEKDDSGNEQPTLQKSEKESTSEMNHYQKSTAVTTESKPKQSLGTVTIPRDQIDFSKPRNQDKGIRRLLSHMFLGRRDQQNLFKKINEEHLSVQQMQMIWLGMKNKLTEQQLLILIKNKRTPEEMLELIEIAKLENENMEG